MESRWGTRHHGADARDPSPTSPGGHGRARPHGPRDHRRVSGHPRRPRAPAARGEPDRRGRLVHGRGRAARDAGGEGGSQLAPRRTLAPRRIGRDRARLRIGRDGIRGGARVRRPAVPPAAPHARDGVRERDPPPRPLRRSARARHGCRPDRQRVDGGRLRPDQAGRRSATGVRLGGHLLARLRVPHRHLPRARDLGADAGAHRPGRRVRRSRRGRADVRMAVDPRSVRSDEPGDRAADRAVAARPGGDLPRDPPRQGASAAVPLRASDPHQRRGDHGMRGAADHRRARRRPRAHGAADRDVHRRPRPRRRRPDHREPDHGHAGERIRAAGSRSEGDRPGRHGRRPRPRARSERDAEGIGGAPPARLRCRGRRHRGARRERRDRPDERGVLSDGPSRTPDDRGAALASVGGIARRRRRTVRGPPGGRTGAARAGGRDTPLSGVARLGDPHRAAPAARADPGRHAGQGGRPDDPIAAEVPPGEGRGSHEPAAADELRDRVRAEPDRARPPRRTRPGGLGRIALPRGRSADDRRR